MPTWPPSVPDAILVDGYGERPPKNSLRTQMDAGPAKVRRRSRAGARPISGAVKMRGEQLEAFDAWFRETLADGTLRFDWIHPRTRQAVSMRFSEEPDYKPSEGAWWSVSMKLEVLP